MNVQEDGKSKLPNRSMSKTLHVNVVQQERENLTPYGYDLSKPVLVITSEDITVIVNIEKTRDGGKEFRHFRISILGGGKPKRTTHYHKALGIALNVATETNNYSLKNKNNA